MSLPQNSTILGTLHPRKSKTEILYYTVKPLYIHNVGTKLILLLRGGYNIIEV